MKEGVCNVVGGSSMCDDVSGDKHVVGMVTKGLGLSKMRTSGATWTWTYPVMHGCMGHVAEQVGKGEVLMVSKLELGLVFAKKKGSHLVHRERVCIEAADNGGNAVGSGHQLGINLCKVA